MITNIEDQLRRDEGFRRSPYKDTRGFWTVGIGHNLDAFPLPNELYPLTDDRISDIFKNDLGRTTAKLIADLPWVAGLADVYRGVLQNMAFNLGVGGLEKFPHMLESIRTGDFQQAADDGTASLWYKQVGDRAQRLMIQLRTGIWQ